MTTHLSTRLVWHGRAWDGHICYHASQNAFCVVHQQIRDRRDEEREEKTAGKTLAVIVSAALSKVGIIYQYEQKLTLKDDPNEFRLPDFTISYEGDTFYWEHLGMLSVPSYKEQWERKEEWYRKNGYLTG
jgi:hypothetical protein